MARPLRIEYPGAVYHVTSRGNDRSDIYQSDEDRELFIEVLGDVVDRFGWMIHAYCLMTNAYQEHGYTMREIASYAKVHYSLVSKLIKAWEKR